MSRERGLPEPIRRLHDQYFEGCDRELRLKHGLYATPPELVSYVVRSIQDLLVSESGFGRPLGLADPDLRLLDPAAGPLNFVLEACRLAIDHHVSLHGPAGVEDLLRSHLLPHFQGIELLPWSQSLGSLAVDLFLLEQGYRRKPGEELRSELRDALAGPPRLAPAAPGREERRLAVVLGNPPFGSREVPAGSWIEGLLRDYRLEGEPASGRNSKWLNDQSLQFLRLAQWTIEEAGAGIAGLVLPHTLLDAPTFRGVRRSLLAAFDAIYALDLHGNRRKGETGQGEELDENVFPGVATGIAVLFLVKFR